jgi:hypothetical protein
MSRAFWVQLHSGFEKYKTHMKSLFSNEFVTLRKFFDAEISAISTDAFTSTFTSSLQAVLGNLSMTVIENREITGRDRLY